MQESVSRRCACGSVETSRGQSEGHCACVIAGLRSCFSGLAVRRLPRTPAMAAADAAFQKWLAELWPQAQSMGVSRRTFDAATRGVEPDLTLPDLDLPGREGAPPRGQAEFVQTPADYVKEASIARLAEQAKKLAAEHRRTLAAIEQKFGVPPQCAARDLGPRDRVRRLQAAQDAHHACSPRRPITAGARTCSARSCSTRSRCWRKATSSSPTCAAPGAAPWGSPSSCPRSSTSTPSISTATARRDIWNSVPDALASAAQQLVSKGWQRGTRWAYEVRAPQRRRLHHRRAGGHAADRRMAQAAATCPPMAASPRRRSSPSRLRCCCRRASTARPSSRRRTTT